ncbi:GDNF-inducible zinc finger protein 1-like [Saccostrea echinata]|uniref:GDNF-inducible zinc finger protein 1-like n=1 Tax=Saccostrea echinata TaxID=191078 RepID=UPI002A81A497|nr:GDNF-inducible zinc finger protein 1-like [Saccostrea echinata]
MKLFTSVAAKLTQDLEDLLCQNTDGCLSESAVIQELVSKTGLMLLQTGTVWELVGSIQSVYNAYVALSRLLDTEFQIKVDNLMIENEVSLRNSGLSGSSELKNEKRRLHRTVDDFTGLQADGEILNKDSDKNISRDGLKRRIKVPDPVVLSFNIDDNSGEYTLSDAVVKSRNEKHEWQTTAADSETSTDELTMLNKCDSKLATPNQLPESQVRLTRETEVNKNTNNCVKRTTVSEKEAEGSKKLKKTRKERKVHNSNNEKTDLKAVGKRSKKKRRGKKQMKTTDEGCIDSEKQTDNSDDSNESEKQEIERKDMYIEADVVKESEKFESDSDDVSGDGDMSEEDSENNDSRNKSKSHPQTVTSNPTLNKKNKCNLCDYVGKHSRDLGQHKMKKHLDNVLKLEEYSSVRELDVSKSDNMLYKKVEEQGLKHIDLKAKNIPCQIKDCKFVAKLKHNMIEHYARMHSVKNLKCKFCNALFSLYRDLKRHLKHHSTQFACDKCGKMYKSSRTFSAHQKTHEENFVKPEYECSTCGKKFSTKYVLRYHIKSEHMGQKKSFICPTCGKSFTQKQSYIIHANVHLGIRPFVCEVCGVSFPYEKSLREHKYMHEEGKKFKCEICGKQFKQPSSLGTHLKIHKETKDHLCKVCGKGFTQRQALLRHERVHSGDKPFSCSICTKNFNDASIIRRHMILVHKINSKDWRSFIQTNTPRQSDHFVQILNGELQPQLKKRRPPKHVDADGHNSSKDLQSKVGSNVDSRAHAPLALSSMASSGTHQQNSALVESSGSETSDMIPQGHMNTLPNSQTLTSIHSLNNVSPLHQGQGECAVYDNYFTGLPPTNYNSVHAKSNEAGIGEQLNAIYPIPVRPAVSEPLLHQYMHLASNYSQYNQS